MNIYIYIHIHRHFGADMIYDRSNPLIQDFPIVLVLDVNNSFELEYCNPDMQIPSFFLSFLNTFFRRKKKKKEKEKEKVVINNTLIMYIYISALR